MHPSAATVSPQEEGFVLLSLPGSAAHAKEVDAEKTLPRSHRLGGGANHWHGRYGGWLFEPSRSFHQIVFSPVLINILS